MFSGSDFLLRSLGEEFSVRGVAFKYLSPDAAERKTTDNQVLILKHAPFLALYDKILTCPPSRNVMEIGVAEGGSLLYFALAFPHLKFVGVDLRRENPAVLRHIDRLDLSERVKIYYETSQDDEDALCKIIEDEFGTEPIGAILDDASHIYGPSRRTVEITLPYLSRNGFYCLEDWGWAHEDGYGYNAFPDQPALSNLVFELAALHRSTDGKIFNNMEIHPSVAILRRGDMSLPPRGFRISDHLKMPQGKKFPVI